MRSQFLILLLAGIFMAFGVGFSIGKSQAVLIPIEGVVNTKVGQPESVDFSLFWDAWGVVQTTFVQADDLDFQAMLEGAISGMVKALGDDYSVFMNAQDTERFLDDISGSFEGVGMEIGIRKGQLQVIAPLKDTPADKAGLQPGDRIVEVNGEFTLDMSIDKAVSLIRGPKGTPVILGVFRDGWEESRDFSITRDVIEIIAVEWEMKEGNIAHIQLRHFSENAGREFQKAALDALRANATGIVLDLRNDPGGFLEIAVDITGWFVEQGSVVVIEDFGDKGKENRTYQAQGNARLIDIPVVVLINQGSASASEIVAGALRDLRGIQLVGEQSFGKGSVQELKNLKDGSSVKITVANWLTPAGHLIHGIGLTPDVEVALTDKDREQDVDPQLDKALELLKTL